MPDHVTVAVDDGLARVRLHRPPVNAINHDLLGDLRDAMQSLAADAGVRGVVLGSASAKHFSAGLDLPEIMGYDRKGMEAFADRFLTLFEELYAFPKPLVCSIPGHCIAGGLLLAVACDYRYAAEGDYQVVMKEIDLGIPVPEPEALLVRALVGNQAAREVLLEGRVYGPREAADIGLLDRVLPADELEAAAEALARRLMEKPTDTYGQIKLAMRRPLLGLMSRYGDDARRVAVESIFGKD